MHLRSILIVTIPLPLAVLRSLLGMYYAGILSNIMSLAGIAIAIGVLWQQRTSSRCTSVSFSTVTPVNLPLTVSAKAWVSESAR